MSNYYEYCKSISQNYYPKVYKDINYHIDLELKNIDKDKLHPFPRSKDFEIIVNNIFNSYKNNVYKRIIDGELSYTNYNNEDLLIFTKDLIKILLIQRIIKDREKFSDYPYYY